MKLKHFFLGLLIWLLPLGLGVKWATGPMFWSYEASPQTTESAMKKFSFRLTQLSKSPVSGYATRIANEEAEIDESFDAIEWGAREARARFLLVFGIWMFAGFFIRWFIGRILRDQSSLED